MFKTFLLTLLFLTAMNSCSNINSTNSRQSKTQVMAGNSEVKDDWKSKCLTRIPTLLFASLCLMGFLYQTYCMNDVYFAYPVRSFVTVAMPETVSFEAMSLCIRFVDVMDYASLNRDRNASWRYTLHDEDIRDLQDSVSISDVFAHTPAADDVVTSGEYRLPASSLLSRCDESNCTTAFHVSKFYYLEYVCYRMRLRQDRTSMSLRALTATPASPGLVFRVRFSQRIARSLRIVFAIHGPDLFPYRSLLITPVILRSGTRERLAGKAARFNRFTNYQRRMSTTNLPAPYESNCFDYRKIGFHSDVQCLQQCLLNRTESEVKRLPFSVILTQQDVRLRGLRRVFSYRDTQREKLVHAVHEIERFCSEVQCRWSTCVKRVSLTVTTMTPFPVFEAQLVSPVMPSFTISVVATIDLTEYFVYLMSIFTTWSGLHALQMNPFTFILRKGLLDKCCTFVKRKEKKARLSLRRLLDDKTFIELATLTMKLDWMENRMQRQRLTLATTTRHTTRMRKQRIIV